MYPIKRTVLMMEPSVEFSTYRHITRRSFSPTQFEVLEIRWMIFCHSSDDGGKTLLSEPRMLVDERRVSRELIISKVNTVHGPHFFGRPRITYSRACI